mmetsp:Transcript_29543/g.69031  ORF Transcript_29543/g.69031 Transcript_29543/m.69031 type:complete len:84 (+) Transcript_29543:187-438(+)
MSPHALSQGNYLQSSTAKRHYLPPTSPTFCVAKVSNHTSHAGPPPTRQPQLHPCPRPDQLILNPNEARKLRTVDFGICASGTS